jgi:hypothetical protein
MVLGGIIHTSGTGMSFASSVNCIFSMGMASTLFSFLMAPGKCGSALAHFPGAIRNENSVLAIPIEKMQFTEEATSSVNCIFSMGMASTLFSFLMAPGK